MLTTKTRKCRACGNPFTQYQSFVSWCSPECGAEIAAKKVAKIKREEAVKVRRADKVKREKLKSRSAWAREAQTAFNAWVRARDADRPCISCGRHHNGQYHAGHYLSVGARPELRYEPLNVWKQCSPCNTHLSGNVALYRVALVQEIGAQKVEWLEGPHEPKKYTVAELQAIKKHYAELAKELRSKE